MTPLILRAAAFAVAKHDGQYRGSAAGEKVPYVTHPIRVAAALAEHGVTDEVTLAAALLHDTLEDTDTTYEELAEAFGVEVADVVAEVTDEAGLAREARHAAQIKKAAHLSDRAKLVKVADKTDNVRGVADAPWKTATKNAYIETAERVVEAAGAGGGLAATFARTMAATKAAIV